MNIKMHWKHSVGVYTWSTGLFKWNVCVFVAKFKPRAMRKGVDTSLEVPKSKLKLFL